ncbi:hypothetical protein ACIRST_37805 [Kitasatospora sp. NPDC101447]|uniref:hypothetical protein n=1 Tax=Kitasatospora sp. NPDC101447 TaxID=3364102 RepID=UPI00380F54B7
MGLPKTATLAQVHAGTSAPGFGLEAGEPQAKYKLAYEAALAGLSQQNATLEGLRSRAVGLITIAAVIASFATTAGAKKDHAFPVGVIVGLLLSMFMVGLSTLMVLLPAKEWHFGPHATSILASNETESRLRHAAVLGMQDAVSRNEKELGARARWFVMGFVVLIAETWLAVAATLAFR